MLRPAETLPAMVVAEYSGGRQCHCSAGDERLMPITQMRPDSWIHYGIVPTGRWAPLYAALRIAATNLIEAGYADEFPFPHKRPGLRVRFQPAAGSRLVLGDEMARRLLAWQRDGLVDNWQGGAYEPEEYLFGGPVSMRSVHRVFTGYGIARAYAGHTDSTGPATTTYIKADLHAVASALSAMTGQPHPLVTSPEDLPIRT